MTCLKINSKIKFCYHIFNLIYFIFTAHHQNFQQISIWFTNVCPFTVNEYLVSLIIGAGVFSRVSFSSKTIFLRRYVISNIQMYIFPHKGSPVRNSLNPIGYKHHNVNNQLYLFQYHLNSILFLIMIHEQLHLLPSSPFSGVFVILWYSWYFVVNHMYIMNYFFFL